MAQTEGTDSLLTQADLSSISPQKVKIAEVILTADAASIQFAGLAQGYRDLEIDSEVRSTGGGTTDGLRVRLNGNASTSTHEYQELNASAGVVNGGRGTNSYLLLGETVSSQAPAGRFSLHRTFFGNYSDAGKWTPYISQASTSIAGTGPWIFQHGGYYNVNEAITSLLFVSSTGANLVAGSRITIYGVNPIVPAGVIPVDLATVRALRPRNPDGIDLSGIAQGAVATPGATTVAVSAFKGFVSDVYVNLPATVLTYPTRPTSGTRLDSVVLRIDNANGGASNPQLAIKPGASSTVAATLSAGDIYSDSAAVYEVELYRLLMGTTGTPTATDVRPIARGVDGQGGAMVKLDEITLSGDAATATFLNIPQSFKHLKLISNVRAANGANTTFVVRCNQLNTVSYDNQVNQATAATAAGGRTNDQNYGFLGDADEYGADTRSWHSNFETTFGLYSSPLFFKTIGTLVARGLDNNPITQQVTSIWLNESAITSLILYITGGNMRAGSTLSIYGVR